MTLRRVEAYGLPSNWRVRMEDEECYWSFPDCYVPAGGIIESFVVHNHQLHGVVAIQVIGMGCDWIGLVQDCAVPEVPAVAGDIPIRVVALGAVESHKVSDIGGER